jgi:hypothetical protein
MRSRNIKPGFFENEILAELPALARLLYIGLWCYADREGRFEWRPKRIKALILPYDECDIDAMLMSLHAMTFIDMYETPNGRVGFIPKFKEHQNPHPHEAKSKLPEKDESFQCHDMQLQCNDMSAKCNADIRILGCYDSNILSASGDAALTQNPEITHEEPTPKVYTTKKGKKLTGKRLEAFEQFWDAFAHKVGRAEAAEEWLKVPHADNGTLEKILAAAKREAEKRSSLIEKGLTPKMAQGWLSGRRWEDEPVDFKAEQERKDYYADKKLEDYL